MATASVATWITASAGARIFGDVDPRVVQRLAQRGLIRQRELPGTRSRFSRADIEQLATQSLSPANSTRTITL